MYNSKTGYAGNDTWAQLKNIAGISESLRSLIVEIAEYTHQIQYSCGPNSKDARELMATALYARIVSSFQALLMISSKGMFSHSLSMLRMQVEPLFHLGAIVNDEDFTQELVKQFDHQKKRSMSQLLRSNVCGENETRVNQMKSDADSQIRADSTSNISISNIADKAGMSDLYKTVYNLCSTFAHPSISALENEYLVIEGEKVTGLKNEPNYQEVPMLIRMSIIHQLQAVALLGRIFDLKADKEISDFEEKLSNIEN